ncbi:putative holin-like toxin [Virgibacillus sp. FSP13]
MTAYEALSLVAQFGLLQIATLTFIVTIVVYLRTKAEAPV